MPEALTTTQFVDETVVEKVTSIPAPTLRSWRTRGRGPAFYRIGRAIRYDLSEVVAWMRQRRALSTTDADAQERHRRAVAEAPPAAIAQNYERPELGRGPGKAAKPRDGGGRCRALQARRPAPVAAAASRRNRKSQSPVVS